MTSDELVQLGIEIVQQAKARGLVVRLYGGVGIYARCPSIAAYPKLQRTYGDLDFMAPREVWNSLPELFKPHGFEVKENAPSKMLYARADLTAEIGEPYFSDQVSLDLAPRLALDEITLPLADLLLIKLQRFPFAEKDIQDSIALLLDHPVASGGDRQAIDRDYIYRLTNRSWGLWTTVFDNTVKLEHVLDKYISLEEAQVVWRRIELLQEVMDGRGKSLGWWLRWIPNRRIKWYREKTPQS